MARGDGRDGQCDWLRDYDGSRPNLENNRCKTAPNNSCRTLVGRRTRTFRFSGLCRKNISAHLKILSPVMTNSADISILIRERDALADCPFSVRRNLPRFCVKVAPFTDLGVVGASETNSRGLGGSDHTSFNQAGLPGIGVLQDPIEYFTHTWHTNLDTYERIVEDDVKTSAAVIAAAVYELAMSDELLPRYKKDKMPKPAEENN